MGKGGGYENVASAGDYQFVDPTGQFQGAVDQFGNMAQFGRSGMVGALDPNAATNAFLGQSGALSNIAQGPYSPFEQSMTAIADRQAQEAGQTAAQQFNAMGAGRSGAAQRAMGLAMAQPFAQNAAQTQAMQGDLIKALWLQGLGGQQALQQTGAGLYGNVYGQGMSGYGNLAGQMGGMMAPQYQYQPTWWDRTMQGGQFAANLGTAWSGFRS